MTSLHHWWCYLDHVSRSQSWTALLAMCLLTLPPSLQHYPTISCDASPYMICSDALPDLSLLQTFGCHVYVLPPRATCRDKLCSDTQTGIFLGYSQTMKNILYYDITSWQIKMALHVVFDQAMSNSDTKTPNAQLCGNTVVPLENLISLLILHVLIFPYFHLQSSLLLRYLLIT